jgi:hypothetical protein
MTTVLCSLVLILAWISYEYVMTRARHAQELEARDKSIDEERARHAEELKARDKSIDEERARHAKELEARNRELAERTDEIGRLNSKLLSQQEHQLAQLIAMDQGAFERGLAAGAGEISIRWAQQEDETGIVFKRIQKLQIGVVIYRGKVLFAFGDLAHIDRFQISDDLKKAILGVIEAAKGISAGISHALPLVA